ncbi:hypothetical protein Bbelb_015630 [Branchiostoma belcheri]|nr:hypothetical protein Bbelb_015630 [Branchiostoma belcheri]
MSLALTLTYPYKWWQRWDGCVRRPGQRTGSQVQHQRYRGLKTREATTPLADEQTGERRGSAFQLTMEVQKRRGEEEVQEYKELVQAGGQTVALCSFLRCMRRMVRIAGFHGSLGPQPCHVRLQDTGLQINLDQGLLQRNNVHHRRNIRKGPGGHATGRIDASSGPAGRILKGVGLVTSADESRRPRMN